MFGGCGQASSVSESDRLDIVVTIFPEYDWVKNILGDSAGEADVTLLLDNGVDLHSFQPTAIDIAKIAGCDLFVYVGGESDEWVEDALAEATNKDMQVINLLEVLGDSVKEEEVKEGMQADHDHDHDHEEDADHDEHVWLSLRNAAVCCEAIESALEKIDPAGADDYKKNLDNYKTKLNELDTEYAQVTAAGQSKVLLFGDRFPFRYMTDDYGIDYYAAFVGCSAETEASFETVVFLAGKVDELGLKHVMTIEGSDGKIAQTIIENTSSKDQDVLVLDSMQSVTSKDVEAGRSYLKIMQDNLEVLRKALD
ncbi:MAG: zinc ABC transporter substrate-binding protein [Lachnospiraceae bacterium]|nr:zinc ABC transporter substrate-binding protein [Lachnospiraceae bacterium]